MHDTSCRAALRWYKLTDSNESFSSDHRPFFKAEDKVWRCLESRGDCWIWPPSLSHTHSWSHSAVSTREVWFYLATSISPCFGLSFLKGSDVISTISIASSANLLTSISLAASLVSFPFLIWKKNAKVLRIVQKCSLLMFFAKTDETLLIRLHVCTLRCILVLLRNPHLEKIDV